MSLRDDLGNLIQQTKGFVRTNRFRVILTPPQELQRTGGSDGSRLSSRDIENRINLSARAAQIPGWNMDSVNRDISGDVPQKLSNTLHYNQTRLQFYVSKDFFEVEFFNNWRELIADDTANRLGYYQDYIGSLQVIPTQKNVEETTLGNAFAYNEIVPKTVGDIEFTYEGDNQVALLDVAFDYRNFTIERTT